MTMPLRRPILRDAEPPPSAPRAPRTVPMSIITERVAPEAPAEPIIDVQRLKELVRFPLGSLLRHRRLAIGTFATILAATILAALFVPRRYRVDATILARRNMVLPALGNPRRTVPTESDAPAMLAAEAVKSRESLLGIIGAIRLREKMPVLISPASRLKESLRARLVGARSETEKDDVLIKMLEKRMWVTAKDAKEGTLEFGILWPDRASALAIVESAQQRFLDRRYEQEVTLIRESIEILEKYVATANQGIATSMAELRALPGVRRATPDAAGYVQSLQAAAKGRVLTGMQADLAAARTLVAQQEAAYTARVSAVQARLTDLEARFGSGHPEVVAARQALSAASALPEALVAARAEEKRLIEQLGLLGAALPTSTDAGAELAMQRLNFERMMRERADSLEDPRMTYARSKLKIATTNYEDMLDRLEAAKIELETARAAFKYRYTVISPAQLPTRAHTPNVPLLLVGGLVCAALAAVFAATARDVFGGLVVEPWQIDRQLGLPLLGEVRRK
jgi:uncharacterized protein involved in exopolysaccharide biosynthesis